MLPVGGKLQGERGRIEQAGKLLACCMSSSLVDPLRYDRCARFIHIPSKRIPDRRRHDPSPHLVQVFPSYRGTHTVVLGRLTLTA